MPANIASTVYGQQGNRWLENDHRSALRERLALVELTSGLDELAPSWRAVEVIVDPFAARMFAIVEVDEVNAAGLELYPLGTSVAQVRAEVLPNT